MSRRKSTYSVTKRHNKDGSVTTTYRSGHTSVFGVRNVDVYTTKQTKQQIIRAENQKLITAAIILIIVGVCNFFMKFWFIGLFCLLVAVIIFAAMFVSYKRNKGGRYITAKATTTSKKSRVLLVIGSFATFFGITFSLFFLALDSIYSLSLPLWIIMGVTGIIMMVIDIIKPDYSRIARLYNRVFEKSTDTQIPLSKISKAIKKDENKIKKEVQWLLDNGYLTNCRVLPSSHCISLANEGSVNKKNSENPDGQGSSSKVIRSCLCPYCGGSIHFFNTSDHVNCEYCGMTTNINDV